MANLKAKTSAPVGVTSPAQLRTAKLPFSQSLARDIEGLAQHLSNLHTQLSTVTTSQSVATGGSSSIAGVLADIASLKDAVSALSQKVAKWVPLALSVNGHQAGRQSKLNLAEGQNIAITDDGQGNVAIKVKSTGPALSTNGARNGSQSSLNLQAGQSIMLTDNGKGMVTITATHSEPLTDGTGNFIFANGDVIEVVGAPN